MNKPILKTPFEIGKMRSAGLIVAKALELAGAMARPGTATGEMNDEVEKLILAEGGIPLFKDYPSAKPGIPPFPAATCISVNEQVVHGIPGCKVLREGDIVSVDVGVSLDGWCGDAAKTFAVGTVGRKARKLLVAAAEALDKGIAAAIAGRLLRDVSMAVQGEAEANGFSVVRAFVGHGIGREMHEPPQVPNFADASPAKGESDPRDFRMDPGLVIAIEPMLNAGGYEVLIDRGDGWTVYTKDRGWSAHFEHTVAITGNGPSVLTVL